jgi:7,8-dihydropterin-6-yl-methyl-4-(beta-D-ribofuranosyl)aminobenzene 5'-phosphate synthase
MTKITILVNNLAPDGLQCEHGLAFWIEYNGKHILFDTGQTNLIEKNAEQMGINLTNTDTVILSHGHYDHTGGIPSVFAASQNATLYLHPKAMDLKYSQKPNRVKTIGMSDATKGIVNSMAAKGKTVMTDLPTEVFPGLFVTGTIPRKTIFENTGGDFYLDKSCTIPDEMPDDQAVYFESENGLVVLLGCGHAGLINTLDHISELTGEKHIHAVLGGMHLLHASSKRIDRTIKAMKRYDIQELGLAHCTGNNAMEQFKKAFPGQCFECPVGMQRNFK